MLGVNATTDSVSRLEKVAWRRTLGWGFQRVDFSLVFKLKFETWHEQLKPAQAGQPVITGENEL
jgi:hypothetical protein